MDCSTLLNPANGRVSHTTGTTVGQTATYSCNPGYNLVGDSIRTCQATGVWSGSAPTCQRMLLLKFEHYVASEIAYQDMLYQPHQPAGILQLNHGKLLAKS